MVEITPAIAFDGFFPSIPITFNLETSPASEEDSCSVINHQVNYLIGFSGRSAGCPFTQMICKGEEVSISPFYLGVIPPIPDASPWYNEYILTDEHGTIVYQDFSGNIKVSPDRTTSYTLKWNILTAIPRTGTGYFFVEVEDCNNETDLEAITILYPTVIDDQDLKRYFSILVQQWSWLCFFSKFCSRNQWSNYRNPKLGGNL